MPWDVVKNETRCSSSKPFGVVKRDDKKLQGCHASRAMANRQLAALNAAETKAVLEQENNMTEEQLLEKETQEKGAFVESEVEHAAGGVPFGITSFAELLTMRKVELAADAIQSASWAMQKLVRNIMADDEITDKGAAIGSLSKEFVALAQEEMKEAQAKERWQPLTDKVITKVEELAKQRPMKTEGGVKFPASDFAFTPDKTKPSGWKLRLAEDRPGNVTRRQLGRAAAALGPGGFRGRKVQIPSAAMAKVKSKIRAAYRKLGVKPEDMPPAVKASGFSIWKEDDGTFHWLAVYSNNYRDDDTPPEIISKEAHEDFVNACDNDDWPHPELWLWHVKGTKWGQTTFLAFDSETGFTVSAGTVDKGKEHIADAVVERDYIVSHAMSAKEIQRSDSDPTIITRYRSSEISLLPRDAAANKHTSFELTKEEVHMIPEHKKTELLELGFDVDALEAKMLAGKEQAEAEGRDSKEIQTKDVEVVKPEAETTEPVPVEETPEPTPVAALDPAQIATAIGTAIGDVLTPVLARLDAMEGNIKELSDAKATQAEAAIELTPAASFTAHLRSAIIGQDATRIDGRGSLAKDKPKEAKDDYADGGPVLASGNVLANTVVNQILDPDAKWLEDLPTSGH